MEKMTNVKAMAMVIEMVKADASAELVEKLEKIKASFEKKSSSSGEKKPTKAQLANADLFVNILKAMESGVKYTLTQLTKRVNELYGTDYTTNKIGGVIRLHLGVEILRTEEKRVAYFEKAIG